MCSVYFKESEADKKAHNTPVFRVCIEDEGEIEIGQITVLMGGSDFMPNEDRVLALDKEMMMDITDKMQELDEYERIRNRSYAGQPEKAIADLNDIMDYIFDILRDPRATLDTKVHLLDIFNRKFQVTQRTCEREFIKHQDLADRIRVEALK